MKRFHMPTAYTILLGIVLVMVLLTWVIPAGRYDRTEDGRPIAGSYHRVEQSAQGLTSLVSAPVQGFYEGIDIAGFILAVGGFLGVISKTGAIDAGISALIRKLKGREGLLIPILMCVFTLGGTTFGMAEETIAFYPLVLPVMLAAGYDNVTAVSVILLGAGVGTLGSTVNPFATGIASGFAGVSLGSGLLLRVVILLVLLGLTIWYVLAYARRVKAEPGRSLTADLREEYLRHFIVAHEAEDVPLTARRKVALALFAATFLVMVYSVIPFDEMGLPLPTLGWWFPELAALFLGAAILTGLLCRQSEGEIVEGFVGGAEDLLGVAFIIGISRGITVVMNSGNITDTVLSLGEKALTGAGSLLFTLMVYLLYLPLSFLIPSSSGLATLSMPIMAPLADFAGVARELVVTAFQSASGLVNLITPTSAVVMGGLAIGHVPYDRWLRFSWKLLLWLAVVTLLLLAAGTIL
ncbi:MAG: YfcC family protein [Oscillospiraceae bacterium]|nr:YfcC family protein [Oscillospiraceae bacterium]